MTIITAPLLRSRAVARGALFTALAASLAACANSPTAPEARAAAETAPAKLGPHDARVNAGGYMLSSGRVR
jgi:hypothetical protein